MFKKRYWYTSWIYSKIHSKRNYKIFEHDILLFGDEPVLVYWDSERLSWMAKKAIEYPWREFPSVNWDYLTLGWIGAEVACIGRMTTQVGGNIHDNPESFVIEHEEYDWEEF